jgi:hypothetical protein
MKRLLFLVVLVLMLAVPVAGLSLTFQDTGEFSSYIGVGGTKTPYWYESPTGGNNYIVLPAGGGSSYVQNVDPQQTTYAAFTTPMILPARCNYYDTTHFGIYLLDAGGATLYSYVIEYGPYGTTYNKRWEVKMSGGTARIYCDGVLMATSGALAQNPSYVRVYGFGSSCGGGSGITIYVDDFVYGASENKVILGSPEQGYFIKKDMINPAASGFCFPNGTIISNYNMTTTWGFGDSNASQTVILKEWSSGYTAATKATTAGTQAGSISWPIYDDIINDPTMPYGYYITTIAGSGTQSTVIPYIATGATVAFDKASYSRGDTAVVSWSVDGGGYWDIATYSYRLDTLDVYGNVVDSQAVTAQAGSKSVAFTTSDSLGVYYAVLIATPISGGDDIWMNFDTCELTGYLVFTGNVYDAETAAVIPVANVSIVQGTTAYNKVTSADGNYTTDAAFYSGTTTLINVTATGYQQYTDSFIPLDAKTIGLNFTLLSLTPAHNGIALGGIARDTVYGRPISLPTVTAANATHAESYSVTGNTVGYYQIDQDDGVTLTADRCYTVTGSKTGYSSASYLKCVVAE